MATTVDPLVVSVGPRVRVLREAMDLSLRDLAARSGVSAQMLSQVERGETSPTLSVASRCPDSSRTAAATSSTPHRTASVDCSLRPTSYSSG